jgi:hypothetical protein
MKPGVFVHFAKIVEIARVCEFVNDRNSVYFSTPTALK